MTSFSDIFRRFFIKNTFFTNVSILLLGTAIAQLFTIITAPLLSRLYSPEYFGGLAFIISMVSIFTVVANLRLELAIVLPKYLKTSQIIFIISFLINSSFAIIIGVLLYFTKDRFSLAFNFDLEFKYIVALIALVFFNSNFNAFTYFNIRIKEFKNNSVSTVIRSLFTNIFQVVFGILSPSIMGLLIGQIIGRFMAICFFIFKGLRTKLFTNISISKKKTLYVLKRYKSFPLFSAPQALINSLSTNIPVFILSFFFSPYIVGLYWFTERLLKMPTTFLGSSIRQVFFQKVSHDVNNNKSVFSNYKKISLYLLVLGLVPVVLLFVYGTQLFEFVFGNEWGEAGLYAPWLAIAWFSALSIFPAVVLIQIYDFQKFYLFYELLLALFKVCALLIGAFLKLPILAIALYSIIILLFNLFLVTNIAMKIRFLK